LGCVPCPFLIEAYLPHPLPPQKEGSQENARLVPISMLANKKHSRDIRVISKVRKTQHQNPEFGHTQGEIQQKTCKKVH